MEKDFKIILATNSSRRIELFKNICNEFEVYKQTYIEVKNYSKNPKVTVLSNSSNKAKNVNLNTSCKHCIIISADTIVTLKDRIYGKPENKEEAIFFLKSLSGKSHNVYTGVTIILRQDNIVREITFFEKTVVTFQSISISDIIEYINNYNPLDKAGAYGIQEIPSSFIKNIDGDYDNVVGLPIKKLKRELESILNSLWLFLYKRKTNYIN